MGCCTGHRKPDSLSRTASTPSSPAFLLSQPSSTSSQCPTILLCRNFSASSQGSSASEPFRHVGICGCRFVRSVWCGDKSLDSEDLVSSLAPHRHVQLAVPLGSLRMTFDPTGSCVLLTSSSQPLECARDSVCFIFP